MARLSRGELLALFQQNPHAALEHYIAEPRSLSHGAYCFQRYLIIGGGTCGSYQPVYKKLLEGRRYIVDWSDDAPSITWLDRAFDHRTWALAPELPPDWDLHLARVFPTHFHAVDVDAVMVHVEALRKIDALPFDSLVFTRGGHVLAADHKLRDSWKFTGLSNMTFVKDVLVDNNIMGDEDAEN